MLEVAGKRLQYLGRGWKQRVELIETELPDFSLPGGKADALLFVFPNIVPPEEPEEEDEDLHHSDDLAVAEYLGQAREPDPEEESPRLYHRFPNSRFTGIDGSSVMLEVAGKRLQYLGRGWKQRVELIETELPDFSLPGGKADALLFVFPNIVPPEEPEEEDEDLHHSDPSIPVEQLANGRFRRRR